MGMPIHGINCARSLLRGISDSVVESAPIDGAGYFRILSAIIWPMAIRLQ